MPDHLHAARVVPDIRSHPAARSRDTRHVAGHRIGIRDEVEHQARCRGVATPGGPRQGAGVAQLEACPRVADAGAGFADVGFGAVDCEHGSRSRATEDAFGQGPGSTTHIAPGLPRSNGEPVDEFVRDAPAPAPDPKFVGGTRAPGFLRRPAHDRLSAAQRPRRSATRLGDAGPARPRAWPATGPWRAGLRADAQIRHRKSREQVG